MFVHLSLLALVGCDGASTPTPPVTTEPVVPDLSTIPAEYREEPLVGTHGGADLSYDGALADPVTAYADCSALVLACLEGGKDFDACVPATPSCATTEPWTEAPCCPSACKDAYTTARGSGGDAFDAFMAVFVTDGSCFPGLEAR